MITGHLVVAICVTADFRLGKHAFLIREGVD